MTGEVRTLCRRLRDEFQRLYGERLRGVFLFGSHARNEADAESDVDVLVVLSSFTSYAGEIERTSEAVARLALEYGVQVSRSFVTWDQWTRGDSPFVANVKEEAIAA